MYDKETWMNVKALRKQGMSYKEIGEMLGMDWRTVKKLCLLEGPPVPTRRNRSSKLDPYKAMIDAWLEMRPKMKASIITEKLRPLGFDGGYTIVKDYIREKKKEMAQIAVVRFETLPGYQGQVDFGKIKVEFLRGREYVIFLAFMLGFSRLRKTIITPDETRSSLTSGLSEIFHRIGGVPWEILLDNMKPAVVKPRTKEDEAVLAEQWIRFCSYYGVNTNPCWPHRAQTKGKVERLISPVKSYLSSHTFVDREHLGAEVRTWDRNYNLRIHSTTRQKPVERFELERGYLLPLPDKPFFYPVTERRKVSRECWVTYEGNSYSVPSEYVGKQVKVKATPQEIQVFSKEGALIISHRRRPKGLGARVMIEEHYRDVPGAEKAFSFLNRLSEMGLSPFEVEKRDLSVYEEITSGDN